jgi:hypothetical protein
MVAWMSSKEAWEPEDKAFLREHYPTTPNKKLANEMGRTVNSIQIKANRLGLVKEIDENDGDFENMLEVISSEEVKKLTKIDLLATSWGLLKMLSRELSNPHLDIKERIKLMDILSSHTVSINNIMRGSEEELGDEEDLEKALTKLEDRHTRQEIIPRRSRGSGGTYVVVTLDEEGDRVKTEQGRAPKVSKADPR